jgi:NAD(P)-dependent dehydrogenase (short-subunit alcohol dehydrogenase family)
VSFYKLDVTDTSALESVCKEIKETHGKATVLVNNAGIGIGKVVLEVRGLCTLCEIRNLTTITDIERRMRETLQGQPDLALRAHPRVPPRHA